MKNKIALYANLVKKNLTEQGFIFKKQYSHTLTGGITLVFERGEKDIRSEMIKVNCLFRLEIRKDEFSIYLFYN